MKNKLLCVVAVIAIALTWWWLSSPRIEVKSLNMTPKQAGDYNLNLLSLEKQKRVYSNLIVVKTSFKGKDYVAAYPQDAVTVTGSGTETRACIYTDNPDAARLEKYIQ